MHLHVGEWIGRCAYQVYLTRLYALMSGLPTAGEWIGLCVHGSVWPQVDPVWHKGVGTTT